MLLQPIDYQFVIKPFPYHPPHTGKSNSFPLAMTLIVDKISMDKELVWMLLVDKISMDKNIKR